MLFTFKENGFKNERPVDNADLETFTQNAPVAKYFRKTKTNANCKTTEVIKIIDCNACKKGKSSNPISKDYNTSYAQYLRSKCKLYEQGITPGSCTNNENKCFVYKKSNNKFNTQGAVSSSSRLLRLKYNTVQTSGKYNIHRIKYRGDLTQTVQINDVNNHCIKRNGAKTICN